MVKKKKERELLESSCCIGCSQADHAVAQWLHGAMARGLKWLMLLLVQHGDGTGGSKVELFDSVVGDTEGHP